MPLGIALGMVVLQQKAGTLAGQLYVGTAEHPEELTDRCCLSALAGLSKYLPLFGAVRIIGIPL